MGVFRALSLDFLRQFFPSLYESMRVDPLRGFFSLTNVEIPTSEPFTIASYPLQVESGTVGSLSLHLPWMHITTTPVRVVARAVHVTLKEPPESAQSAVFAALLGASQGAKHRRIIEAETDVTPFTRAIQKLLPFLLHRVELDLCDIQLSIRFSTNYTVRCTLSSITTHAPTSSHADLAKTFVLKSFSIQVWSTPSSQVPCAKAESTSNEVTKDHELLSLNIASAELMLTLTNSQYDFDLTFPRRVPLLAHANLLPFLQKVFARRHFWHVALIYKRPAVDVKEDPSAWFQYTVRAVRGSLGTKAPLRVSTVRRVFRACVEYQRLHVLQLQRRLSVSDESTLHELESELDLDAILLIRAHARKYVLADDISSFAAQSWLSWALFGNQMKYDSHKIAADIRRSLCAVDKGDVESTTLQRAISWSKVRLSFRMADLGIRLKGLGLDLQFLFEDVQVLAEVGSAFDSFSAMASITDMSIFCGPLLVLGRGSVSNGSAATAISRVGILTVRANKSIIDQKTAVQVQLDGLAIVFDLHAVQTFIRHLRGILSHITSLHPLQSFDSVGQSSPPSRELVSSNLSRSLVNVSVSIPQYEVFVLSGPCARFLSSDSKPSGLVLTFKSFEYQSMPGDLGPVVRGFADVSIQSGSLEAVACNSQKVSPQLGSFSMRLIDKFGFAGTFGLSLLGLGCNTSLTVEDFHSKVDLARLAPFLGVLTGASKLLYDTVYPTIYENVREFDSRQIDRPGVGTLKPRPESHFRISSMVVEFTRSFPGNYQNEWITIHADACHIHDSPKGFKITINMISMAETSGGRIHIRSTKETDEGLTVTVSALPVERCVKVEATVGNVNVELPPSFVVASFQVFRILEDLAVKYFQGGSHRDDSCLTSESLGMKTSVEMRNVTVELPFPCGVCAALRGVHIAYQDTLLNGTCETLQFEDLSTSHLSSMTYSSRLVDSYAKPEQKSLSFNLGHGFLNVHLSCVHILMFVSTIHRIHLAIVALSSELSSTGSNDGTEPVSYYNSNEMNTLPTSRVTIKGSNVSLGLVVASTMDEYVCFDVREVVTVISPGSHIFSIRKLTVLTGSAGSMEGTLPVGMQGPRLTSGKPSWHVILRHVDIDASHHASNGHDRQGPACKNEHKLFITVLSRIMIFLAPSQVRILISVLAQLLMSDSSNATSPNSVKHNITNEQSENLIALSEGPLTQKAQFCEFSIECEFQPTSIELLSDHDDGSSSSTIASIELDPVHLSLKIGFESSLHRIHTTVLVWEANCPSLRIEDRGPKVSPSRRVVVETEDSWLGLLSSLDDATRKVGSMGLFIGGTSRFEHSHTSSSYEIRLERARIVLSSTLHARIVNFFKQCALHGCPEKACDSETPRLLSQTKSCLDNVATKVSVVLINSSILLLSKDSNLGDHVLEAYWKTAKASFLISESGFLTKGSMFRWKNLHLSLIRGPLGRFVHRGRDITGLFQNNIASISFGTGRETAAPRSSKNSECDSVLMVKNGMMHLPTLGRDRYRVVVSDAALESSVTVAKNTLALLSSIDTGATSEKGLTAERPGLKIVVIRLLAKIKIPMKKEDLGPRPSRNSSVILGLDTSADVEVLKGTATISGNVQLAADITDSRGHRTHLMSPTPLFFSMDMSTTSSLKCWTKKYARVTMSPLIVKTLAGLTFSFLRDELNTRHKNGPIHSVDSGITKRESRSDQRQVHVSLKGIFVYFLVDEPRMQLMRLMLRDVIFNAHIPTRSGNKGTLNISVLDLTLEDSISWRMPWKPEDASAERWSTLVTGRRYERTRENISASEEMPSGWQGSANAVRSWILRMRGPGSAGTSPEFEEMHMDCNTHHNALPLISCTLHWVSPMEHVAARLKVQGLDFHVDLAVLSSITEWIQTAINEVSQVKAALCTRGFVEGNLNALNVRVDHIVLEPVCVRVAIRAPPRRIRETLLERIVNMTISAETAEGVELRFPKLIFSGDFFGMESVFQRIEALYIRTVTSRLFARQLLWQFPNFLKSARVIIACFSRRREYGLLNQVETVAFSEDRMRRGRRDVGLLTLLTNDTPRLEGIVGTHWQISPLLNWTAQDLDTQSDDQIATLDITQHVT